jgi:NADH:ubiquinone oxidoreductase subunit 3 (subunit A)
VGYAIIFLVFDIEAVFLLPFATIFSGLRLAGCMSMLVFVMLLVAGLVWAYKKNVLTWS